MDVTQALLAGLVALVLGWFATGVIWNIRRGSAVLKWMQAGLPRLGERTTLRWLGSSAVMLAIERARPPFRRVELVIVLEPRDVPWFWLLARARGRRDLLIVRGQLVAAPQFEYDWLAPRTWSERERRGRAEGREWPVEDLDGLRFQAPQPTLGLARTAGRAALAAAQPLAAAPWRLSARRGQPHFELHLPLPHPARADAPEFFAALRRLAEAMGRRATDGGL